MFIQVCVGIRMHVHIDLCMCVLGGGGIYKFLFTKRRSWDQKKEVMVY